MSLMTRRLAGVILLLAGIILFFIFNENGIFRDSGDSGEWLAAARQMQQQELATRPSLQGTAWLETGADSDDENHYEPEVFVPTTIIIPALDLEMQLIDGDVFSDADLRIAPVHFQMSDLPGTRQGNAAFAAHRRGQYAYFRDLDLLSPGDEISLETDSHRLTYQVAWIRIVDPYDWSVIDSTPVPALTLQTCEPKNSPATHRLIVRAYLTEWEPTPLNDGGTNVNGGETERIIGEETSKAVNAENDKAINAATGKAVSGEAGEKARKETDEKTGKGAVKSL